MVQQIKHQNQGIQVSSRGFFTPITLKNSIIPHNSQIKYFGLILNRKLTWGLHLKAKQKKLNSRLHLLIPLLRSELNISNKLFISKRLIRPIWTYICCMSDTQPKNSSLILKQFKLFNRFFFPLSQKLRGM